MKSEKILLIIKAYPNFEKGKAEYDWEFPEKIDSSRMLGILDLIKHDLIHSWNENVEEENEN